MSEESGSLLIHTTFLCKMLQNLDETYVGKFQSCRSNPISIEREKILLNLQFYIIVNAIWRSEYWNLNIKLWREIGHRKIPTLWVLTSIDLTEKALCRNFYRFKKDIHQFLVKNRGCDKMKEKCEKIPSNWMML